MIADATPADWRSAARLNGVQVPKVLVYHPDAPVYVSALEQTDAVVDVRATHDEDAFRRWLPHADVLVAKRFPVDALTAAKRLRWIQVTSAGVEFLAPARESLAHLTVTNARGIHGAPIADYVIAVTIMLQANFLGLMRDQAAMRWRPRPIAPLHGRTLGVIGVGAIGQEIARRASACGMNVVGVRRGGAPVAGIAKVFRPEDLSSFLAICDFVVVAVPATESTRTMIGRRELQSMKPTAFLVNIARGAIVDEAALVTALKDGTIAGACLDVFDVEPLPPDSPLWTMPNVIVTPHIAGMRSDYVERFMDIFLDNLARFSRNAPLRNVVNLHRGY